MGELLDGKDPEREVGSVIEVRYCPRCRASEKHLKRIDGQNLRQFRQCDICGWCGRAKDMVTKQHLPVSTLQHQAYINAKEKGFHDHPKEVGTLLALIHSELSEALEAHREGERWKLNLTPAQWKWVMNEEDMVALKDFLWDKSKHQGPEHISEEMADAVIRLGDMAGAMGIDLEQAVIRKMQINEDRARLHGKRY